ncbi:choline transporter [Streptococcus pneumoniae]|nr:choline transporter [Streptococcus pneumoniae]
MEGQLKAGFTLEFNDREDGNKGLQSMYGLNLNVATMQPALRYQAIQSGDIQITDAYSTDAELERYDLQVLEDDKQLFPPYQGAPLMKEALLKKYPELERVLNTLAGKGRGRLVRRNSNPHPARCEEKPSYQGSR